jgi:peptide/nickel transport system substrate-binding protein
MHARRSNPIERTHMSRSVLRTLLAAVFLVAVFALAACGDDENGGGGGSAATDDLTAGTATENEPGEGKRGGTLTMLAAGDVDFIDPGMTYYSFAFGIMDALHRKLYSYEPNKPTEPTPDLAEGPPEISEDGRTVTIKIRPGVMFSEPVNREVTSKDIKYAIERAFSRNVTNGYARAYLADIQGAPEEPGPVEDIPGIETPDDQTIVFKLTKATGAVVAGTMGMPISAPVPEEYARRFDRENPSTYGQNQVFTGPYMIEHNSEGRLTGYRPNRFIRIVRNPQYQKAGDFRPAFVDRINIEEGNEDSNVASRRILDGQSLISGDGGVPPTVLRRALTQNKDQISLKPSGGFRYVSFDTKQAPFDDANVRKAVIAGFDRNALRLARGGEAIGPIANHFLPPGLPGHEESGGLEPPEGADWLGNPRGDRQLMAEYFRKAGMESGRYEGDQRLLMVSDNADPDKSIAQSAERQLEQMGFNVQLRLVNRNTMFTRYCNVPDSDVHVCPSVGWLKDFSDPQTMLDPTFNGDNILDTNNSNWPELDVKSINDRMNRAKLINDPEERAQEWAEINKLITLQAPGVPYVWDLESVVGSKNVRVIQNQFSTLADLNYTSLR